MTTAKEFIEKFDADRNGDAWEEDTELLAQAFEQYAYIKMNTVMVCTGCGHLLHDPLPTTAVACCPDNSYVTIREFIKQTYSK